MKWNFIAWLIFWGSTLSAQDKKPDPDLVQKNFYNSLGFTAFTEFNMTPIIFYKEMNTFNNGTGYYNTPIRESGFTFISFTWCPRVNLYNLKDKASVSLDMPMSVALSLWGMMGRKNVVNKDDGTGHFTLPAILMFNFGNGSTWNNMSDKGFAVGFGLQYTVGPFSYGEQIHNGIVPNYPDPVSAWTTKVFALSYRFAPRKTTMEINLRIGPGRIIEYQMGSDNKQFNTLRENCTYKLTMLFLLHY